MLILQGLLTWVTRSLGRFFQAAFGWAVVALFGPRPRRERAILSAAVGAAAFWPVLALGIFLPGIASFVLAFVPLSKSIRPDVLRGVWAAAALAVPVGLGILLGSKAANRGGPFWRRVAEGFPATLGIACSFVVTAIAVPVRKVAAFARDRVTVHLPVVVAIEGYGDLAGVVESVLTRADPGLTRRAAPLFAEAPVRILRAIGGPLFRRELPPRLAAFRGRGLGVVVSPNGVALEGPEAAVTRARGLLAEALTCSLALQTLDPEAQKLERRVKTLVGAGRAPAESRVRSKDSLERVAEALLRADVGREDFEVLHRELLQAACAMAGQEPLLMSSATSAKHDASGSPPASPGRRGTREARGVVVTLED